MTKPEIVEKILARLREFHDAEMEAYRAHKDASVKAPSAMESASDTTKFQEGQMADKTLQRAENLRYAMVELEQKSNGSFKNVNVGALVRADEGGEEAFFYVVPEGAGGQTIRQGKDVVQTVAIGSPMGKALMGKCSGERVELRFSGGARKIRLLEVL